MASKFKFVDPNPFFRSHMKMPRGFGSWAFVSAEKADWMGNYKSVLDIVWINSCTYSNAKKQLPTGYWYAQP